MSQKELDPGEAINAPRRLEPVADEADGPTSDQLRQIAKIRRPPKAWFEEDEEQLFTT